MNGMLPPTSDSVEQPNTTAVLQRPLSDLVLATLKAATHSKNTERGYTTAIGLFLSFLDKERGAMLPGDTHDEWRPFARSHSVKIKHSNRQKITRTVWTFRGPCAVLHLVDAAVLEAFKVWREERNDSPSAISTRLGAVRTFLSVALREGVLTSEHASDMRLSAYRPRQMRTLEPDGRRLLPSEVQTLRKVCAAKTNRSKRDRVLLDVILYAGLRREEAAMLNTANFVQNDGQWWILLNGKGKKKRRIKVHKSLYKSLSRWLDAAGLHLNNGHKPIFYLVDDDDVISERRLNNRAVGRLVAECGHAAGLAPLKGEDGLSPHDLRRTFARNAYDNGSDLIQVQTILGHSDPKTTARYIGALKDEDNTAVDYVKY